MTFTRAIYVDVFGDPALQDAFAEALGLERNIVGGESFAELVSVINIVLPPPRMQREVDRFFTNLTSYLAGDTAELDPELDFGEAADSAVMAARISDALIAGAVEAGAFAMPVAAAVAKPLAVNQATDYLDQLTQGIFEPIPTELIGSSVDALTPDEQAGVVGSMLGPVADTASARVKRQMRASLAENDVVGALTTAMRERIAQRIEIAAAALEIRLAGSNALNMIDQTAAALGTTGEQLIASLNVVRGYAILIGNLLIPLAILLALLLGVIVWMNSDDLKGMLQAAGWTLTAAGGTVLLVWLGVGFWLRGTVQRATGATTGLPNGLEAIIDDVIGSLTRNVWDAVWGTALIFFLVGLVLLAFAYSRQLLAFLSKLLAPVWDHKGWLLAGVLGLFVLVPLLIWLFSPTARADRLACNGHIEFCDRPANEIAYPVTHNSMSISDYGWLWAEHDATVKQQLEDGIRGLLIDSHYADSESEINRFLETLSPSAQTIVNEAVAAGDFDISGVSSFLCHNLCALGATALTETLNDVRLFLEENPREVIYIVIQDEVSAADTADAFAAAGLNDYIYTHPGGDVWPTLGEMIDADQRLVVMAENEGPPPDWYQNVWDNTMETPYTFINYDDFSCRPNRGDEDKAFFLMNHWIQRGAPNRVDSAIVNEYDFLLSRAQQCAEERGKMPNFVAVNFYQNGDLFDVVDMLNGVSSSRR